MLTSRSSNASKLKNNFSTSSYRDKHVGQLFSFCQNEKEKIRITRGTTDDGCYGQKTDSQRWKKNKNENPSSSPWLDSDSNLNPCSWSLHAKENSKFPFILLLNVALKDLKWKKSTWKI